MSIKVLNDVWNKSAHSGGKLLCLLAIADNANDQGFAYPSLDTISRKSRMTVRNAQYAIKALAKSGEIIINQGQGKNGCNLYKINLQGGGEKISNENFSIEKRVLEISCPPDEKRVLEISPEPSEPSKRTVKNRQCSGPTFKKPTKEEIESYMLEIGWNGDAENFLDYYESNGWRVGKNPMRDWRATVRTWKRRDNPKHDDDHTRIPD